MRKGTILAVVSAAMVLAGATAPQPPKLRALSKGEARTVTQEICLPALNDLQGMFTGWEGIPRLSEDVIVKGLTLSEFDEQIRDGEAKLLDKRPAQRALALYQLCVLHGYRAIATSQQTGGKRK